MQLDELKAAWQAQAGRVAPADQGEDMRALLEKVDRLERNVRRRDLREYVAACFVIAFFGWRAATAQDMLVRIGALIVVFGAMFIIVWSRRAAGASSRRMFAGDLPIAQFCARELERIEAQVRLLKTAWWWYVTPTIVGVLLMVLSPQQPFVVKITVAAVVLGVGAAIGWANWWTAKYHLEPLRDELAERLAELR